MNLKYRHGTRLAVALLAFALAGVVGASAAYAEPAPVAAHCIGTGGYDSNGVWTFTPTVLFTPAGVGFAVCGEVAPDAALVNTSAPILSGDTSPFDNGFWAIENVIAQGWPIGGDGVTQLSATGNFSCGNGTLTGITNTVINNTTYKSQIGSGVGGDVFSVSWQATFTNGIGQVTGTATAPDGTTKQLNGVLKIDDRGSTSACNDSGNADDVTLGATMS